MRSTELKQQRDAALFEAYKDALETKSFRFQRDAVNWARTHQAPRFFVSPIVCALFMSKMEKGLYIQGINASSRRKYDELFRRFRQQKNASPSSSTISICEQIVEQTAPEFYIGYVLARTIINREIKRQREIMLKRYGRDTI